MGADDHRVPRWLLDSILVSLSLFVTIGYHGYLWYFLRRKPLLTTIGMDRIKRRRWFRELNQSDDKKGMLAVQSLRNTLMATILTSSITILVAMSMAVLANNSFDSSHLFAPGTIYSSLFGSENNVIIALKYGSVYIFLLASFFCSSIALACLIDANFLINAICFSPSSSSPEDYTHIMLERGFSFSVVGNRLLCISFPLLAWLFGPLPMVLSSLGLVWGLYELDFAGNSFITHLGYSYIK